MNIRMYWRSKMFKYIQKKRAEKAKQKAEIQARIENRERESEARREREKNRIVLTVPDIYVEEILALYDAYRDDEINKNVNKYLLWEKIESVLLDTKEGNWFISINGSNVIHISQIFSDVHYKQGYYYDNDYRDSSWDATRKKLV